MSSEFDQLFQAALQLPEYERGELAARLIDTLDPTPEDGVEAAWDAEIRQRLEELQTGQVRPISWAEARQRILEDTD